MAGSAYQITAYTDSFAEKDFCDEKYFAAPENIVSLEYDYIIIAIVNTAARSEVKRLLTGMGVPEEKIVEPVMLINPCFVRQKNLLKEFAGGYCEGIIAGMSYSLRGIIKENIYNRHSIEGGNCETELGGLWRKKHKETIDENIVLFRRFLHELRNSGIKAAVIIPPFYLPAFNEEEKTVIEQNKSDFYEIMQNFDVDIFDYFEELQNAGYYADATHLNYFGAVEFTGLINKLLPNRV